MWWRRDSDLGAGAVPSDRLSSGAVLGDRCELYRCAVPAWMNCGCGGNVTGLAHRERHLHFLLRKGPVV